MLFMNLHFRKLIQIRFWMKLIFKFGKQVEMLYNFI